MDAAVADRAAGVLLGSACGDALGAGYEFGPPLAAETVVDMVGGGPFGFAPGEWTDDTSMALCVAEAAAAGHDLRSSSGLDAVAAGFRRWFGGHPKDVGIQTAAVLAAAADGGAAGMTAAARNYFTRNPQGSAGNGSLMRTAAVALAYLRAAEPSAVAQAAVAVSELTHADPVCGEACVLWSVGVWHAVRYGTFDGVRAGLSLLSADRAGYWAALLDEAEARRPADFGKNGWVVQALQAAWSAVIRTPVPAGEPGAHLRLALEEAVRGGRDTDTVAAIAGGLLGARWGAGAVPARWRAALFGWPGYRADDLDRLARAAIG